jgi:hypothetical protein
MYNIGKKAAAAVMAGLMTISAIAPATAAFAVEPSAGPQTGTGVTDVTVQYKAADLVDVGGTEDPNNPDVDPQDGLGDNLAFTVPASINFVADSAGKLTGPSKQAAYIENESAFSIHASAFKTDTANDWTIVRDDTETATQNAVDFQFGPEAQKVGNIDAYDYQAKTRIADVASDAPYVEDWNMAPKASEGIEDRVQLNTSGDIHNVTQDITEQTKVAKIHTYVTAGNAVRNGGGGGGTTQGEELPEPATIYLSTETAENGGGQITQVVSNTGQMTGSLDAFFEQNYGEYDFQFDGIEVKNITTWEEAIAGVQEKAPDITAKRMALDWNVMSFYAGNHRL